MDSVPWAAAGGFMSKYGPKNGGWHVGSTWVIWHCGGLHFGEFDLGSLGDLCIHWVNYL